MDLTPVEISLVQETWGVVAPEAGDLAALFYTQLFQLDPSLQLLFHEDMQRQGEKLTSMLGLAVSGVEAPYQLLASLRQMGIRHEEYSVQPKHYETVKQALLWTLAVALDDAFTGEVELAWAKLYDWLAECMLLGATAAKRS